MFLYLLPTILITALGLVVLVYTAQFTSPTTPNGSLIPINLVYFFVAAFVSLAGSLALVLYWVGNLRLKKTRSTELESIHKPRIVFKRSLRHGILLATAIVGIGLLNALDFANPLNIILLVSALVLVEVYFFGH